MRQLTLTAPRELDWLEVAEPALDRPDAALVRPLAVAACDIDALMVEALIPITYPVAMGHELVAAVIEAGPEVRRFAVGDCVVVPYQVSCGACAMCSRGLTASCATVPHRSSYGFGEQGASWGGALSDLVLVPFADHMLVAAPAGVEPVAIASAGDNIADGWRAVAPALAEWPGEAVLIVGGAARSVALYAVAIAKALGAGQVDYLDTDGECLGLAERLGARPLEGPPPRRAGSYRITVDASWQPEGLSCAIRSTAPGGSCTSVTPYFQREVTMPLLGMYDRGCTFRTGRVNARAAIPEVLALIESGKIDPAIVTTQLVGWDDAAEALRHPSTKLVIERHRREDPLPTAR